MSAERPARARRGYTLLEVTVAASIFTVVAYVLVAAVRLAGSSSDSVFERAEANHALRESTTRMSEELRGISETHLTITELQNGSCQVSFQMPIEVGGAAAWGVQDNAIGRTVEAQTKPDWSVRYTVEDVPLGAHDVDRRLLRQLLDEAGVVRFESEVLTGLSRAPGTPAFTVSKTGLMWQVTLCVDDAGVQDNARTSTFQFRARNG
jgi:hypothetical protein